MQGWHQWGSAGRALLVRATFLVAPLLVCGCQVHVVFGPSKTDSPIGEDGIAVEPALAGSGRATLRSRRNSDAPSESDQEAFAATGEYEPISHGSRRVGKSARAVVVYPIKRAGLQQPAAAVTPPELLFDETDAFRGDGKSTVTTKPLKATSMEEGAGLPGKTVAELDLAGVLYLAGAENWMVHLAAERVSEAEANLDAAKAMWLPSLNASVGWNKHDGQIQDTGGSVIDVSRNSLFVGGGAVVNNAPLTGASGGPARMFVDLSLADAIFAPRAACQLLAARQAGQFATFNDTLLAASLTYTELVRAQDARTLADANLNLTQELLKLTETFEKSGKGTKADVARVEVEIARRRQDIVEADLAIRVASAELARLLRIDTENAEAIVKLAAKDTSLLPVDLVSPATPLAELIAQAVATRPEIDESDAQMFAARARSQAEKWRPLIPNLHLGVSSGGFGGGLNGDLSQLDGRADIDLLAVWQVRNLGFGTAAARRAASSRLQQANLTRGLTRDRVVAEVETAHVQVQAAKKRRAFAAVRVERAEDSRTKNMARIKSLLGLPLEALQAVTAVIQARQEQLAAAAAYNRAQLRLLRAVGRAISAQTPAEAP